MHLSHLTLSCLALTLMAVTRVAWSDATETLDRQSDTFETARVSGNLDVARALVLPDATSFSSVGHAPRPLMAELRTAAKRREKSDRHVGPDRVVSRNITMLDGSAVVTELLGAAAAEPDPRVRPQRRSIVWTRDQDTWKIAHIHTSAYARWEKAIAAYEAQDKQDPPDHGGVVFVGSSSIRGWKTLTPDFPGVNVIGRGFGGSQIIDSVLYAHRIVIPHRPRAVVVYAGDNDIAAGKSPERVFQDFQMLVRTIHTPLPQARIAFIAIKPSPRRWKWWPQMKDANQLVAEFAAGEELVDYLDVAKPMLGSDGLPREELFVKDQLHLNAEGYALWTSVVRPWIEKR